METSKSVRDIQEDELPTIRGRMVAAAEAAVPDFTAEWKQIRDDLEGEATCALRIGESLIRIRDALKPLGLWLAALREHGMSQPQASRYIRYAQLPEADRAAFQRAVGFSLSEAVGERTRKNGTPVVARGDGGEGERQEIPEDELSDRLAEIDRRRKLAIRMIDAGEGALAGEPQPPEYADDQERWRRKLSEVAADVLTVISEGLEAELKKRLLPGLE